MPPAPPQQDRDNSLDFLWIAAGAVAAIILSWYFGKVYITKFILLVRYYEIFAINFAYIYVVALFQKFHLPLTLLQTYHLNNWLDFVQHNYGSELEFSTIVKLSNDVGNILRFPSMAVLIVLAFLLYFTGVSHRFRHTYSTKSLELSEQQNWPQITPVTKLDLVTQKLDEGPWAMAIAPMPFCKKHNLLDVEMKNGRYIATLRRGSAYRMLALQLGSRWSGPNSLPMYLKALLGIFSARACGDKKAADNLIDNINRSSIGPRTNFAGTDVLLRKYFNNKKVQKVVWLHAYITTAMASMLVAARESGVLSTSEFIWLKPLDRRMWYMLNSVGRQTAVTEISGAFSHWLAEKKLGLPLVVPMVDEAVNGLEIAIKEMIYKPDEKD